MLLKIIFNIVLDIKNNKENLENTDQVKRWIGQCRISIKG
jgi:hypothetical protein